MITANTVYDFGSFRASEGFVELFEGHLNSFKNIKEIKYDYLLIFQIYIISFILIFNITPNVYTFIRLFVTKTDSPKLQ